MPRYKVEYLRVRAIPDVHVNQSEPPHFLIDADSTSEVLSVIFEREEDSYLINDWDALSISVIRVPDDWVDPIGEV